MGYKYIELGILQDWCHVQPQEILENTEEVYERITKLLHQLNLEVIAFNSGMGENEKEKFKAMVSLAHQMEVPLITLPSGSKDHSIEDEVKRLAPLLEIANDYGVQLTVESHIGSLTEQPEQAYELLNTLPGLGLTLDISHYYCNHSEKKAEMLLPYVEHVHFRDCGRGWENIQLPYGEGLLDMEYWMKILEEHKYTGNICIEYIDLPETTFDHIKSAQECLDHLMNFITRF